MKVNTLGASCGSQSFHREEKILRLHGGGLAVKDGPSILSLPSQSLERILQCFKFLEPNWSSNRQNLLILNGVNVPTSGETPQDIEDLESALRKRQIDGFVSGALRSDYQKSRLERMAERLDLISWTPLWHQDGDSHLSEMVDNGFEIMVTGVSCEGLDESWLGTILNRTKLAELRHLAKQYRFHIEGEGGEYETLVISGPHMDRSLDVEFTTHWDGVRGHLEFH